MGNDGGTILRRSDLVRVKDDGSDSKVDPAILAKVLATTCGLSRQPLRVPVVSDNLGYLYNKDSIVKYLLSKVESSGLNKNSENQKADGKVGHIKKLKDVKTLNLTENPAFAKEQAKNGIIDQSEEERPAPFMCPLNQREMSGRLRFVYLKPCGCVMSESGLRAMISDDVLHKSTKEEKNGTNCSSDQSASSCPVCSTTFLTTCLNKKSISPGGDVIVLNGTVDEVEAQREAMERKRTEDAARKKEVKAAKGTLNEGNRVANGASEKRKRKEKSSVVLGEIEEQQTKKLKE